VRSATYSAPTEFKEIRLQNCHLAYKDSPFRGCYVPHKPATLQSPPRGCSMSLHKEVCGVASTDLSSRLRTRRQQTARVATVALVAVAYFAVIIVVLHFLRADLNPISSPTSEYAVGRYGFLMSSAFFSMSLGSFALVIGLYRGVSKRARSGIGLVLLGVWAVGVLIAMSFPIDPEGAPQTISGTIHRINGPLGFLSLTAGTILVSRRFKQDGLWRPIHRSAVILSLVMLTAFIANFLNIATASGFGGLCQRIFLVAFVTWFLLTATRLRSISSRSVRSR
jgi:hypothetical protein